MRGLCRPGRWSGALRWRSCWGWRLPWCSCSASSACATTGLRCGCCPCSGGSSPWGECLPSWGWPWCCACPGRGRPGAALPSGLPFRRWQSGRWRWPTWPRPRHRSALCCCWAAPGAPARSTSPCCPCRRWRPAGRRARRARLRVALPGDAGPLCRAVVPGGHAAAGGAWRLAGAAPAALVMGVGLRRLGPGGAAARVRVRQVAGCGNSAVPMAFARAAWICPAIRGPVSPRTTACAAMGAVATPRAASSAASRRVRCG